MMLPTEQMQYFATLLFYRNLWEKNREWILKLDTDPMELQEFIKGSYKHQLGRYCEQLLQFFFIKSPYYELLAHNLQLFENRKTLGELDFLIKDVNYNKIIHIELAVKFYIALNKGALIQDFYGPNANDKLQNKLQLLDRQIKLTEEYAPKFTEFGNPADFEKYILLKGVLFYDNNDQSQCPTTSHNQLKGTKLIYDENLELEKNAEYYFPKKREWLNLPNSAICFSAEDSILKVGDNLSMEKAIMLYKLKGGRVERIFIVNEQWPEFKLYQTP